MRKKNLLLASLLVCQGTSRLCFADNPIVQTMFTADPAALVHDETFYMYTGHDEDGAGWFDMREWRVFSTTDMANWTDLGSPMNLKTFTWGNVDAWAAQCVFRDGKFYYYVPIRLSGDRFGIGVGVSDKPEGPFTDVLGKPLVEGNSYIDPTVYIDSDGQAYMYWGNTGLWMVKLNKDMISISGSVESVPRNKETFDDTFGEAPWLYKRDGLYYMLFASKSEPAPDVCSDCNMENLRYSTSTSPLGPWKYRGMIMPAEGKSWTNHPAYAEYKGNSYFVYHNGALPGGGSGQRSVCVEEFTYNDDGTIPRIPMTKTGPKQLGTLNPFKTVQAETIAFSAGLKTEKCSDSGGGMNVTSIHDGDYIKVNGVNFGSGATEFEARVASAGSGGKLEIHLDSMTGTLVGSCPVQGTGAAQTWATKSCTVENVTGVHDVYFTFVGSGTDALFNFNWWKFNGPGAVDRPDGGGTGGSASGGASASTGGRTGGGAGSSSGAKGTAIGTGGGAGSSPGAMGTGGNGGSSVSQSTFGSGTNSTSDSDSSGCGCRLGSRPVDGLPGLLGVLLGVLLASRRKS